MSLDQDIALLRGIHTFDALSAEALRTLAISAERRQYAIDSALFRVDEPADCGFVLVSGRVELAIEKDGTRTVLETLGAGSLLGEVALMVDNRRTASAVAVLPTVAMRITRSAFLRTLEGYPDSARQLRQALSQRLDTTLRDLDRVRIRLENSSDRRLR